jgi:hypothetical protein
MIRTFINIIIARLKLIIICECNAFVTSLRDFRKIRVGFIFYRYLVPNGTVPEEQNIGRMLII